MVLADEQLHFAAKLMERSGQLAGDIAAAGDGDALRPLLEGKKAVGGDAELGARQLRHHGPAAGRDHDVPRGQARAVYLDRILVEEAGGAAHVGHALGRQIALVDAVQAQHVRVALALQNRPIVAAQSEVESIVARIGKTQCHARGVPHDLLGNAADVHAGSSQAVRFDHRDLGAELGGTLRAGEAAAAAADADEIEGLLRHCELHRERPLNPDDILPAPQTAG